ncbi:hypothetical protein [Paenibacillus gorillae]|uniref:hypothetical protein n=1 Tax=Paenibacillus gorillae TaxID=1243662 RepID=UPI0004B773E2|nr:hypothetical protein [Paenibacillus gorillae]
MFNIGATLIVLLFAALLLGAMFFFIRISTDDSDKYKEWKEMVESLFGTPAFLRPGAGEQPGNAEAAAAASAQPFTEQCPACGETVTEQNTDCPSCGLRLL